MGDLTENLSRHEFECPCGCGTDTVDIALPGILQMCVYVFQERYPNMEIGIHINSGNRCPAYNATIPGASETSKHTIYRACDFYLYDKITGHHINDDEVADYLEERYKNKYGIGRYNGRTHFDNRSGPAARWDMR